VKASLKWLRDFVDVDVSAHKLAELLSNSGTKVEGIDEPAESIEGVVVAEVVRMSDHPNADKLTLVEVKTASGQTQEVVCGARNFARGDRVPLAGVGARLPGITIEAREIRGVVSNGMLCSGAELGISRDHSGILVLPRDAELGRDVTEVLGLDDAVLELEVTPNRGDSMGMIGIAREVAALLGKELRLPDADLASLSDVRSPVSVEVEDPDACRRYVARFIERLSIGPSPSHIQSRLVALGVRPVSNVVDITNYVMLETGQPLHAFDAAKIAEHEILVRRAREGEELRTLDGQQRSLHPDDLLIADARGPVGLAGLMGGENTEVSNATTAVILESANFDSATVAFMARRHVLRSEASTRFERGVDPEMAPFAAARAARLMADHAGGAIAPEVVDVYPAPAARTRITLRPERTNALLGYDLSAEDQAAHLRSLELEVDLADGRFEVEVPSFRRDLQREVDLIEEIARLAGFERLPSTLLDPGQAAERRLRRVLAGFGLYEAWTSSFGSPGDLDALGLPEDHPARRMVKLANPTSELDPVLRTTLLPGLLRSVARNLAQHAGEVALFEVARIYEPSGQQLPREELVLAAALTGTRGSVSWTVEPRRWDFFAGKGVLEGVFAALGVEGLKFSPVSGLPFHPTRAVGAALGDSRLGILGELHPDVCERFEIAPGTVAFEIALAPVFSAMSGRVRAEELSRFPAVYIDLAFVVDKELSAGHVEDLIGRAGAPEVRSVRLFDVYSGEQIPEGKKSLAYALELRADDRTLTDADAEVVTKRIVTALEERTGAQLRA
jgi:phenylalanyl-tRNA synthetase beta chain